MINNDMYYKKYLKYKKKYTELKGQIGGECPSSNNGYTKAELFKKGCPIGMFDIKSITKEEIDIYNNNKITIYDLIKAGFSKEELISAGFDVSKLQDS
jgi:hypothetical protein